MGCVEVCSGGQRVPLNSSLLRSAEGHLRCSAGTGVGVVVVGDAAVYRSTGSTQRNRIHAVSMGRRQPCRASESTDLCQRGCTFLIVLQYERLMAKDARTSVNQVRGWLACDPHCAIDARKDGWWVVVGAYLR